MKKIIIIFFSIVLGVQIFNLILGPEESSLRGESQKVMIEHIKTYQ